MGVLFDKFFRKKLPVPTADPNHPFMKRTFKDDFLSGKICEGTIMDYVVFWNTCDTGKTIEEFLGMSSNQYLDWITNCPVGLFQMLSMDY
jgi:hypothetical protein